MSTPEAESSSKREENGPVVAHLSVDSGMVVKPADPQPTGPAESNPEDPTLEQEPNNKISRVVAIFKKRKVAIIIPLMLIVVLSIGVYKKDNFENPHKLSWKHVNHTLHDTVTDKIIRDLDSQGPLSKLPYFRLKLEQERSQFNNDRLNYDHTYYLSSNLRESNIKNVIFSVKYNIDAFIGIYIINRNYPAKEPEEIDKTVCIEIPESENKEQYFLAVLFPFNGKSMKYIKSLSFDEFVMINLNNNGGRCHEKIKY